MTTEYTYTDVDGDVLHVRSFPADPGLSLTIKNGEYGRATVEIARDDVRQVTAVMHDKAGLPDRWELLRNWLGAGHESWCADVLARMTELEAGR